jgi:hypothetical protein
MDRGGRGICKIKRSALFPSFKKKEVEEQRTWAMKGLPSSKTAPIWKFVTTRSPLPILTVAGINMERKKKDKKNTTFKQGNGKIGIAQN